jgi:ankyrin repeat protein
MRETHNVAAEDVGGFDVKMYGRGAWLIAWMSVVSLGAAGDGVRIVDAAKQGDREAVRALLKQHADVNAPEADGTTALHWAVRANDLDTVTLLIRAGARVKAANRYGVQPLSLAAMNGDAAMIQALLKAGADANSATGEGEPVLMTAARTGSVPALKVLMAHGANVNAREGWMGETPLIWAASENNATAVQALVDAGAEIDARSTVQDAPVLPFLLSGGPNSPFPRGGWTPLMYAARQGALQAARALADAGANLNLTALPETDVTITDADKAGVNAGRMGTTALVFAIINAHYDLAAMLLEKGANPNIADSTGMAALYAAVDMSTLQWVQGRPHPVLTDKLDAAALVTLLLEHGADPNVRLKSPIMKRHHDGSDGALGAGTTPLMRAAKTGDVDVMRRLLARGANPFLTQANHTNALMIAAAGAGLRGEGPRIKVPTEGGAIEAMKLLLEQGVDVNAFNDTGTTALHAAVNRGDALVKFLAGRGANLTAKNKAGQTALDIALGQGGQGGRGRGGRGGQVRESTAALLRQLMSASEPKKTAQRD